ncbi:MAG: terminase family protein [Sphingobacteriaceae bacterium]|nr:terminase family protein [Sphingobacteriaceae bacterium]
MVETRENRIRPQAGFQMQFLSSPADIVIGGAAAGVGKTYALLLEILRHKDVKDFGAVCFRRTSPQIKAEGALWDTSSQIFPLVGGVPRESTLEWQIDKAKVKFSHLEYEKNIYDWQGSQIPLILYDELTHFTKKMFFYLLTRNRSVCGIRPYVRATCNPDPESWLAEFISWWIDQDSGFPIPEREGKLRYLVVDGDSYIWGDSADEVIEKAWYMLEEVVTRSGIDPREFVKSVTFISGSIYDNKELLKVNPAYLGNLLAQDAETQAALLKGNWKVVISDKDIYNYSDFAGMFVNKYEVNTNGRYITADIAMKGSNKFIAGVWYGDSLEDLLIMDKSKGNEVINGIINLAKTHKVPNNHIAFDNDGVGQFVDGFIEGAVEFNNGAKAELEENYANQKTQCYYRSGDSVSRGEKKVSERVANMMYDDTMTVRQRFMFERKAIKRDKADYDGKLKIIGKDQMKSMLNGESPDLMDMFMMREKFKLVKEFKFW